VASQVVTPRATVRVSNVTFLYVFIENDFLCEK